MGEARIRKERDPLYGQIPKALRSRGIVVGPPSKIEGSRMELTGTALDPASLRTWLLFWDQILWPVSHVVFSPNSPDIEYLMGAGVLSRPEYPVLDADLVRSDLKGYLRALQESERRNPGCWSLAQGEKALQIIGESVANSRDVLVSLHQAVPVPAGDVPLAEILEFKERRSAELLRFRHEIERFYLDIENSNDQALALNLAVERIETACADLIKVNKEWKYGSLLSDWDFSITPMQWGGAIASFALAPAVSLDAISGLLNGTIGAALSISPGIGKRIVEGKTNPYRYVASANKELRF